MSDLQCPHCYGAVPRGARVCRGCHAEVEYGPPGWSYVVLLVLAVVAGVTAAALAPSEWRTRIGWGAGGAVFLAGGFKLPQLFAGRVVFIRHYRSK